VAHGGLTQVQSLGGSGHAALRQQGFKAAQQLKVKIQIDIHIIDI
jgi:hypothetical protein